MQAPDRHIPHITTQGTPFLRGRGLGRLEPQRVRHTVRSYMAIFRARAGLRREAVFAQAERFMPVIAGYAPALLEEMHGIADGAGCDVREIVAINARTELMYGVKQRGECTAIGVQAQATPDGHVWLAQNWDWHPGLAGSVIAWHIRPDDGPELITLTEAGIVGKIGINAYGLAMCINLLISDSDHEGPAVPMHVLLRTVLDTAHSVQDAIDSIANASRCTSCHHLLADRTGDIAGVEATPIGQYVLRPVRGIVTHTNHCVDVALFAHDKGARDEPETLARGMRIAQLAHHTSLDKASIQSLLADHGNAPNSICLHPQHAWSIDRQGESVASVLFDLTAGTMDIADGPPCQYTYRQIQLDWLNR